MQYVKCNLCGSKNFVHLFRAPNYSTLFSEEEYNIVRCKDCGLVFLNPRPEDEQLNKYYPPEYFLKMDVDKTIFFRKHFSLNKARFIKKLKDKGRLLDVGCGRGEFLQQMEDNSGWEVWGVDISQTACKCTKEKLKSGRIFNQDLLSFNSPESYFDVITFWDTFEHLNDPFSSLLKARQILKKDGVLVIHCPNFSSFTSKFSKNRWPTLQTPCHLYQFSSTTLQKLLDRAGFEVFGLRFGADLFDNMVSFKFSILNWLNKKYVMFPRSEGISAKKRNFPKMIWIADRFLINIFCLLSSMLLAFLKKGDYILCCCSIKAGADGAS